MPETAYPFDEPIDPRVLCRNCVESIVATAVVYGNGLSIKGLNEYRWVHADGQAECPPPQPPPVAQPYDGWEATRRVEAVRRDRLAAEDAR